MNYFDKSPEPNKVGEIKFDDEHVVLRFAREDYKYINQNYFSKILRFNTMIDEIIEELRYRKLELRKMEQLGRKKRMLWAYPHPNTALAAKFFEDFNRMELQLESMVIQRLNIIGHFHEDAVRVHHDQTIQDKKFEPDESAEAKDLVTLPGVAQAARQITNETTRTWDWYALGRSDVPADFDDDDLKSPINRYFIKTHGAFSAIGEVIRLLVVSPDELSTDDIAEVAVADLQSGGNLFFRAVLDKKVHHEAGQHFLAASANVYLASRR